MDLWSDTFSRLWEQRFLGIEAPTLKSMGRFLGAASSFIPRQGPSRPRFFDEKKVGLTKALTVLRSFKLRQTERWWKYENDIARWIVDDNWINFLCNKTPMQSASCKTLTGLFFPKQLAALEPKIHEWKGHTFGSESPKKNCHKLQICQEISTFNWSITPVFWPLWHHFYGQWMHFETPVALFWR